MDQLIQNYHLFYKHYFTDHPELYRTLLETGQHPKALVISCCDSRVDPAHILQTQPGDLFVIRNIASWVPPYEQLTDPCSVSAALSFGVHHLEIPNIIVFGHSHCAGVKTLSHNVDIAQPIIEWTEIFNHETQTEHSTGQNVLIQAWHNLYTYPWIKSRIESGTLKASAWMFCIDSGIIENYNVTAKIFEPLR
jgi:carbonic anhydrase